jgi:hypothetical protein
MKSFRDIQEAVESGEGLEDGRSIESIELRLCERKLSLLKSRKESELEIRAKELRKQSKNHALKMEKQSQNYEMKF